MNEPKHNVLYAAYLYYYATDVAFQHGADDDGRLKRRLEDLVGDALVIANEAKFDVFNCLTLMDNPSFLTSLRVCTTFLLKENYELICRSTSSAAVVVS